jgi:8-oxo-dGTP diphosphatase
MDSDTHGYKIWTTSVFIILVFIRPHPVIMAGMDSPVTSVPKPHGIPVFGERLPGVKHIKRPGAYALIFDAQRRLAVIQTRRGCFLPGGGIQAGESPEEGLRREIREECGLEILILSKLGESLDYLYASQDRQYFEIHSQYYLAEAGATTGSPSEEGQVLVWLPVEAAIAQLQRPGQAWAVKQTISD